MIDAARAGNYNEEMEERTHNEAVDDYVCMYRAEPQKRFLSSGGALYAALLLGVIGAIMLTNALSARWHWPRAPVQITLYALLLALAGLVYRYRLTAFRYVLTKRALTIDRVVGSKVTGDIRVRLSDVAAIRPYAEGPGEGRLVMLYTGRRRDALALCLSENGQRRTLLISPSEEFKGKLIEQWKNLQT